MQTKPPNYIGPLGKANSSDIRIVFEEVTKANGLLTVY